MNNKYVKYYKNFKPPPFAPTFRPTEEDFVDPLEYVKKIKGEAEKYGVVKIKPPKSFRPPFAIKSEEFVFTPRVQRLNEIDGLLRLRLLFEMEISVFWELQGQNLVAPMIDNRPVDLFKLSRFVSERGGSESLTELKKWTQIGKQLGLTSHHSAKLRDLFNKWIAPLEKCLKEIEEEKKLEQEPVPECSHAMEGRRRVAEPKSRMMAGYRRPIKEKKVKVDPVDDVICSKCKRGDDEEHLLLCEECNAAQHTQCCDPPLTEVPEGEWRCYGCIKARVKLIGESFGFHDAQQEYNLVSFAEFANSWKRDYFQKKILDVTQEEVEKEFWRRVIDMNNDTIVKYGADLLASKVGSGFPSIPSGQKRRKSDENTRFYAEHPWNLNNMPVLQGSVLSHIESGISGMMVPWVYIGMCFTTFCWHTEDHWTYSINYMHWGERKIWYGVSGLDGEKFEKVLNGLVPDLFRKHPDLLHHMTTMINPMILMENGVNVYTVHQEPGEFVITFPRAYHAGYNEGLNCAEAVNFAPPDWLRLGRLCINEYARVHRRCVFSQDELVTHMVQKVGNLDLAMRVAVYDELEKIVAKEKKWFARFPKPKFRHERTKFERIQDDQRECAFCKTTLYLSALECKHGRLSCLKHADHLCDKCPKEQGYVKYRHTTDELAEMREEVAKTVEPYAKWKEKALSFLHPADGAKPSLEDVRELLNLADALQLPSCETLDKLKRVVKDSEDAFDAVSTLLLPKIRARFKFESSSLKKYDFSSVMKLKSKVDRLSCGLPERLSGFNGFIERLSRWKERVKSVEDTGFGTDVKYASLIDEVRRLMAEAEDFCLDLPEVENIKKKLNVYQWLNVASKLLRWRASCSNGKTEEESMKSSGDTSSEDAHDQERWKLRSVEKLVDEGTVLMEENEEIREMVDQVHSCMKLGWNKEFAAEKILLDEDNEGAGLEKANKIWRDFEVCNWLSMDKIDELRTEIVKARNIQKLYTEGRERSDITFTDLATYEGLCSQSFFMKQSPIHKEIVTARNNLQNFMERIRQMFVYSTTYYSLYDIVCGREDLELLLKGMSPSLIRMGERTLNDDWGQVEEFASSEELASHLRELDDSLCSSVLALRQLNAKRTINETCSCGQARPEENNFLVCSLCLSKFHGSCARWGDFLSEFPSGYYLCVRCLRGHRPALQDVRSECASAPPSLEKTLIQFVVERCSKVCEEASAIVNLIENLPAVDHSLLHRLDMCMILVLSSVAYDRQVSPRILAKLPLLRKVTDAERALFNYLKYSGSRMPEVLFPCSSAAHGMKGKRPYSIESGENSSIAEQKRAKKSEQKEIF